MSGGGRAGQASGGAGRAGRRVTAADVEWVAERVSERDWLIIETVNRLRLVRGDQLERLFLFELSGRSRVVSRGRVLRRLVGWHVLQALPRRIGGAPRGSSGSVFALGSVGRRLLVERQVGGNSVRRVRHAGVPTERTVRHTVAVSELYVGLMEQARATGVKVATFVAEPGCWWPNGLGGYIKPDAYLVLEAEGVRQHTWVEVDLTTENLPTIKRKLLTYLDYVQRGQLGPSGVVPNVLVTTTTSERRAAIDALVSRLAEPAAQLFTVQIELKAQLHLIHSLKE